MSQEPTKNRTPNTPVQALTFLLIISLLLLLASSLSAYFNSLETENRYKELAKVMGRSIFREMVVVRRWNAEHGGVYVPVTEGFQPNPYLEDARRDVTTADGITLTKINPEYMTRLLSEHLEKEDGIKIHITSLKLTSPRNKADSWEEGALHRFEQGSKEEAGILGPRDSALFRYMAPLVTEEACLDCHGKQGYKVKDIRGG